MFSSCAYNQIRMIYILSVKHWEMDLIVLLKFLLQNVASLEDDDRYEFHCKNYLETI